jgi:hypothetical protein
MPGASRRSSNGQRSGLECRSSRFCVLGRDLKWKPTSGSELFEERRTKELGRIGLCRLLKKSRNV